MQQGFQGGEILFHNSRKGFGAWFIDYSILKFYIIVKKKSKERPLH